MSVIISQLSKLDKFLTLYHAACLNSTLTGKTIFQHVLDELDVLIEPHLAEATVSFCSCIIVSNHPTGPLDGVLIGSYLDKQRINYKIVANSLLSTLERLRDKFIFVCVEPKNGAEKAANATSISRMIAFVKSGGCCVIFPSGEVEGDTLSTWSTTIGYLARNVKCTVIPMYIHEGSSFSFNISKLFGRHCRVLCLPRQLFVKRNRTIRLTVGSPVETWMLRDRLTNEQMTNFLRDKVGALKYV